MILIDTALARREAEGRPIRVGLIGAGFMARGVALQIIRSVPGMRVAAIANRTLETARRAYQEAGVESVRTVETYRAHGRLPEATMVGRTPTWTRAQIDQWQATRPGQGARTDLRPKH